MILQRTRPPLLETPFEVFDRGVFTPNDQFFVRWHWAVIPRDVDVAAFRLTVRGHVNQALSLSLADLLAMPRVELAAVINARAIPAGCSSRACRAANGRTGRWEMRGGPASACATCWIARASRPGLLRFDSTVWTSRSSTAAPEFMKSLDIDHARDGEVMLAFQMNGEQLPLLNGFPLRLIVPGWYSTYWVKMLSDIEVLDAPDENYWMKIGLSHSRYAACEREARRNRVQDRADHPHGAALLLHQRDQRHDRQARSGRAGQRDCLRRRLRRLAGGASADGGQSWQKTDLGRDEGTYSFRQWSTQITAPQSGTLTLQVRCTNTKGEVQPAEPNWNGGGFMRNVIERVQLTVA